MSTAQSEGKEEGSFWEVVLESPEYDLTIFKLRCGWFTLKIYTKGECVLRVETIAHNVKKLPCGCSLQKFPAVVAQLQGILKRFMDTLGCMDQVFLAMPLWNSCRRPRSWGRPRWEASISTDHGYAG